MATAILKRLLADLERQQREGTLDDESRAVLNDIRELLAGSTVPHPPDLR